jgi:serine/threonine-protein kinase RsbT
MMEDQNTLRISMEIDFVTIRSIIRRAAIEAGFGTTDVTRIVTAASELARNAFRFAGGGNMHWRQVENDSAVGIELIVEDKGPGIPNIEQAMQPGYTTGNGLGLGLPGTKRLMNDMVIRSEVGRGTAVTVRRWRKR